jgi:hypothetical protein
MKDIVSKSNTKLCVGPLIMQTKSKIFGLATFGINVNVSRGCIFNQTACTNRKQSGYEFC